MCSAPVHVKLHVSLQQITYKGELSGFDPSGKIIEYRASQRFFVHSGGLLHFFDADAETIVGTCADEWGRGGGGGTGSTSKMNKTTNQDYEYTALNDALFIEFEACICQRVLQSLRSRESQLEEKGNVFSMNAEWM